MYLTRALGIDHKKHVVNMLRGMCLRTLYVTDYYYYRFNISIKMMIIAV